MKSADMKRILLFASLLFAGVFMMSAASEDPVRILQLNIWQGGTVVPGGAGAIADEIVRSDADLVFLAETRNPGRKDVVPDIVSSLAEKGVRYFVEASGSDVALLSKAPVEKASDGHSRFLTEINGQKISAFPIHLDYRHYACYLPRGYDGAGYKRLENPVTDADSILAENARSSRIREMEAVVEAALKDAADGYSVIVAGDFNEPSHLDWTKQTASMFGHNGAVVRWPCSDILLEAGFVDVYREIWPDPVANPGFTYPSDNADIAPERLTWAPEADERERIDFIYLLSDRLVASKAAVYGPSSSIVKCKRTEETSADVFMEPSGIWPTDHKGVYAELENRYTEKERNKDMLRLGIAYSDGMVLPSGKPLEISGKTAPDAEVRVRIAGQSVKTTADGYGNWTLTLAPLKPGTGYVMKVSSAGGKLVYEDVAAGEVWVCSGQSNMAFVLKFSRGGKDAAASSADPDLRFFNMKSKLPTYDLQWSEPDTRKVNAFEYFPETSWIPSSPEVSPEVSAVAYYFGRMLRDSLDVPVGLIINAVGGTTAESWMETDAVRECAPELLEDWYNNSLVMEWTRTRAAWNMSKCPSALKRHPFQPGYLFEAGIRPLGHFPVSGVIWYQGESNVHDMALHEKIFPVLVRDWRDYWNEEELPFYFVQLSSIDREGWPEFRDSQRRLMEVIPHTGMAVSSDKGNVSDVHPAQKREVGERLARWALHDKGVSGVVPSGPLFRKAVRAGRSVIVEFEYGEGLGTSDGKALSCFEVAGEDSVFFPAVAEIKGDRVIVYSEKVDDPEYIRYAWQPYTEANLVNGDMLPASTFMSAVGQDAPSGF